jgi:His/Glu/Gln/Arg/opine family amino acid ABC transporter permease subunit
MNLDFGSLIPYASLLAAGVGLTVLITVCALVLSFPMGFAGALIRVFGPRPLRAAVTTYVELVRNVPFLPVLYLLYFGLPAVGLRLDALPCGILALTLNSAAYTVEIFRGGLAGIPPGQYVGARSLGMRPLGVFRYVIYPQLLRLSLPALGNQVVSVFLGSSLVSTIGVAELTYQSLGFGALTFRYFEVFTVAAVLYIATAQVVGISWRSTTRRMLRVRWS